MSNANIRTVSLVAWLGLLAFVAVVGVLAGARPSPSTVAFLLVTCVAPPIVMMMVWRGAPPPTVAEVIRRAEGRQGGGRAR